MPRMGVMKSTRCIRIGRFDGNREGGGGGGGVSLILEEEKSFIFPGRVLEMRCKRAREGFLIFGEQ